MLEQPTVMFVDDDVSVGRALAGVIEQARCRALGTCSLDQARRLFEANRRVAAVIVDVEVAGENGLDFLAELRSAGHDMPVLVYTAHCDRALADRAYQLGARYLVKPALDGEIEQFLMIATGALALSLGAAVQDEARRWRLTAVEARILLLACQDSRQDVIADAADVSVETVRTQVRFILDKCGAPDLRTLVARLHRRLLAGRAQRSAVSASA